MLIGLLATLVLRQLGKVAMMSGEAKHYQANTEMKRRLVSLLILGLRVSNDHRVTLSDSQQNDAYDWLLTQMQEKG